MYNSRHFEQILFDRCAESLATRKPLTIAISDIDHFKKFNDLNGHAAGDEVLKHVAKIFQNSTRPNSTDIVFRYGGEEFCMLLSDTRPEEAIEILEKYRAAVEESSVHYMGHELKVNVSVGLATSLIDANDCKALFERADEALYACKHNGRNQVRHYAGGAKVAYRKTGLGKTFEEAYRSKPPEMNDHRAPASDGTDASDS